MSTITTHLVNTTAAVAFARHRAVYAWCPKFDASHVFMSNTKRQRLREPSHE